MKRKIRMTDQKKEQYKEQYYETTIKSDNIYKGHIVSLDVETVELPDMKYAKREIISHPRCVGLIPLTEKGTLHMVRQFRCAVKEMMLEIPAGLVDLGESPQEAALRECQEEIKYKPGKLTYLMDLYSSPGYSNEKLSLFLAEDLSPSPKSLDETEFLQVAQYPIEDLYNMVKNFEITDSKTVVAILYAYFEIFKPNEEKFLEKR